MFLFWPLISFTKNIYFLKNVTETGLKAFIYNRQFVNFSMKSKKNILGHEAGRSPTAPGGISESPWAMVSAENDCSGAGFVIFRVYWVVDVAGQNFQ